METEKIDVPKFDGFECIGYITPGEKSSEIKTLNSNGRELVDITYPCMMQICYRKVKPKRITLELTERNNGHARPDEYVQRKDGTLIPHESLFGYPEEDYRIWRQVEEGK